MSQTCKRTCTFVRVCCFDYKGNSNFASYCSVVTSLHTLPNSYRECVASHTWCTLSRFGWLSSRCSRACQYGELGARNRGQSQSPGTRHSMTVRIVSPPVPAPSFPRAIPIKFLLDEIIWSLMLAPLRGAASDPCVGQQVLQRKVASCRCCTCACTCNM